MSRKPFLFGLLVAGAALLTARSAVAQDPFEIQVYEYETVSKGRWNLETHINYTGKGTTAPEGSVAPSEGQFHTTFELTRGLTNHFELAGYLVLGSYRGGSFGYAGARVRPRVMVPKEWGWPLDSSLSLEVGFPRSTYEENPVTLEIRPILEKKLGAWQIDVNPVIGTPLKGSDSGEWDFEPCVRIGWEADERLDLSVEYYGGIPFDGGPQVHQIFPGGDIRITEDIVVNVGVGFGLTDAGNRLVWKSRIGVLFD